MGWAEDQFENKMLFRRIFMIVIMGYLFMASHESFLFVMKALDSDFSAAEVAGVVIAKDGLPVALLGYLYRYYSKDRQESKEK
ncbi:MAG: hypothetical protein H6937_06915 [Burkholderiales bacterium]|nr:hypothetical protein [Burkholderiales bacterium]